MALIRRLAATTIVAAALAGVTPPRALAMSAQAAVEACLEAARPFELGARLPRTAARLRGGGPLAIVAVGSSSTRGLWMIDQAATYPAVMQRELVARRPGLSARIVNAGRVGATIPDDLARLTAEVLAHAPDLVVWQAGTNDVAWGGDPDGLADLLAAGVRSLKTSGADVVLMDLQYAPMVLGSTHHAAMQAIIARVARSEQVGLFQRFAVMRRAVEQGVPKRALVSWDGLHHSAAGYDCIGRALARAVLAAAR